AFSAAALGYLIFSLWGIPLEMKLPRIHFPPIASFVKENAQGVALALIFFAVYLFIGLRLNFPDKDTTDNFLSADNYPWMQRIAAPDGFNNEMRAPHPFAYLIFRPLGAALNLFTQDPALSAILLTTFTGALCILLAWMFIKRQFQDSIYAFLIASLLGLSTAHIFFGSVVETYIFSAAAMIAFFLLLQSQKNATSSLISVSLLTFGITLTNFIQNFIGFVVQRLKFSRKDFWTSTKETIKFAGLTLSFGVVLSVIHAALYPTSKLFFLLSGAQAEQSFEYSIFQEPAWRAIGRALLLVRTIVLYAVVAPKPYVFSKEVGGTFPRFNFFKIVPGTFSYSAYSGLGNILVAAWALLLLAAGVMFLANLIRAKKLDLSFAFALCVLFNFILHINYGYEPFLYSPDWTYALIFFVALALAPLAKNRLFQAALFIFLILLAYNQFQFFKFIFETIAPFVG
ncbi:MAG: hypothetical protein PHQ36_02285, partial [Anaerolineales bacterium]|nr:hypothetical protein [Anaerolineales bacterium]